MAPVPAGDSRCPLLGRDGFSRRKGVSFLPGKLAPLVVSRLAAAAPPLEPPIHPPLCISSETRCLLYDQGGNLGQIQLGH